MPSVVTPLVETVSRLPEAPAVVTDSETLTYQQLWTRASTVGATLTSHGIESGDRVVLHLPNTLEYIIALYGTLHCGAVVVPINPQCKEKEVRHELADSGAKLAFTQARTASMVASLKSETALETVVSVGAHPDFEEFDSLRHENARPHVSRAVDDLAFLPYTSGTTGKPKGVDLTHGNVSWNARQTARLPDRSLSETDRMLAALPLTHIYGLSAVVHTTLISGGTLYLQAEWDAKTALEIIEEEAITTFHGVPTMYADLVAVAKTAEFDCSSLRFAGTGGAPMARSLFESVENTLDITLFEGYGLTETAPVTHFNRPNARRPGSVGTAIRGIEWRVVDETFEELPVVAEGPIDPAEFSAYVGDIVIAGPTVMEGYHNRPGETAEAITKSDGKRWFHTGDLGYRDADGFCYLVGREDQLIVTAGYNVYPREVEFCLSDHDAVAEVAVVGVEDERRGETVKAYVVPEPGIAVTEAELVQHCLDTLAPYKHPREVEFVEDLPRTDSGKVKRHALNRR